jgi:Xaa-Pro aminopeptidase
LVFSEIEKKRRFDAARRLIADKKLKALLLVGNGAVGTNAYGCYRYFVNNKIFYYLQAALFFPDTEPIAIVGSIISEMEIINKSFIDKCRCNPDIVSEIIEVLKENRIDSGDIGVCMEMLPATWLFRLQKELPNIRWVETYEDIFTIRNHHSSEEIAVLKECAGLADIGYEAVCRLVKPGMTEMEIAAGLDYAMQKSGAEECFTLISSGRFAFQNNQLECIHSPTASAKKVEFGESVAMEITPRYKGYWTQLVRTVNIGNANHDLSQIHKVAVGAIQDVLPELKPGKPIGDIVKKLKRFIENAGYIFTLPCGHICAIDLNEERLEENNSRPLIPGMVVIIHPSIVTPQITNSIFWGESYLITENGHEKLMNSSHELITV